LFAVLHLEGRREGWFLEVLGLANVLVEKILGLVDGEAFPAFEAR
jgi:hypothetical protein